MTSNRVVTSVLCLGICLAFAAAFAPAAGAQSLAGYNCIQNLSNSEFKTSSASSLANACQSQQNLAVDAGKRQDVLLHQEPVERPVPRNKATKLSSDCNGDDEYWNITPVVYQGETVYCVQNVGNSEYLTSSASQLSKSCGQQQYWRVYNPQWACVQNQGNTQYLENHASQMADTCVNQGTWWVMSLVAGKTNVYCVQNLANLEYLTSSASKLSSTCNSSNQWWVMTAKSGTCMQNYANGEYMTNNANSLSSTCNSTNQYWNFTGASYSDISSN